MSRTGAVSAGQLATLPSDIFVTPIIGADGRTSVASSSQELSEKSFPIDKKQNNSLFFALVALYHCADPDG